MEFSRAVTEAFCSRTTNKFSALHNNIPMQVVKLSIMQLSRRHTDTFFNKGRTCCDRKNGANVRKALAASNCSIVQTVSCNETHFRSWRRSSSITFIIDIISFDQYFRSYREKLVRKTLNLVFIMLLGITITEPRHEKTNILHMRKQRCRSASR